MDAFQEFYHAPVLHAKQSPIVVASEVQAEAGFEAPHYEIDGPHRLVSTVRHPGVGDAAEMLQADRRHLTRSGLFGPWDAPDLGVDAAAAASTRPNASPWGLDSFQLLPNFVILIWERRAGTSRTTTGRRRTTRTSSRATLYFVRRRDRRASASRRRWRR